jgi:hypothetical protein
MDLEDESFCIEEDSAAWGWLCVNANAVGFGGDVQNMFCGDCQDIVLKALGYPSKNIFENTVKDNVEKPSVVSVTDTTDEFGEVPFYLIDSEDYSN